MPTYLYCEINDDGSDGETFEIYQSLDEPHLLVNPRNGRKVRKVFCAPNVALRYTGPAQKTNLSNERVEKLGFTKYQKDKLTGTYHKVAGKDPRAPAKFNPRGLPKD